MPSLVSCSIVYIFVLAIRLQFTLRSNLDFKRRRLVDQDRNQDRTKDWRELCKEAATELDPVKLMNLIAELTRALNERDKNGQRTTGQRMTGEDRKNGRSISLDRELAL